jgi:protein-S-isoprenylcysteine O-methyltransferase Ste14
MTMHNRSNPAQPRPERPTAHHAGRTWLDNLDHVDDWPELNWPHISMRKLLPPVLVLIALALMVALRLLGPGMDIVPWPLSLAGIPTAIAGLAITVVAARRFSIIGTNIKTFDEPGTLVTDGLFGYSRNPMYLGFVLFLVGLAVGLGTLSPLLVAVAFAVIADRWYVRFEEVAMAAKFGDDYVRYKQTVRRWI